MPRMCTNRYVRQAQKAVLLYFRDFKAIEVQLSHVYENPVQRSLNSLGRKTTERSALHFRYHEEAVTSGTADLLIQGCTRVRLKYSPRSGVRLAFQIQDPHCERTILNENSSELNRCL